MIGAALSLPGGLFLWLGRYKFIDFFPHCTTVKNMRNRESSHCRGRIDPLCRAKTRIGLTLFGVYALCYGVFIAGHVVFPHWTDYQWGGVAAGVVVSVGLLLLSVLIALLYHLLCCRAERASLQEQP